MRIVRAGKGKVEKSSLFIRPADLITTVRWLLAVVLAVILAFSPGKLNVCAGMAAIILIFFMDYLDGMLARRFEGHDNCNVEGAFYDIAGDRTVECVLQVPFVYAAVLNPLVLIYYLSKNFMIDHIRYVIALKSRKAPFMQGKTRMFVGLVSSRIMRGLYGFMKVLMFLLLLLAMYNTGFTHLANIIAYITVFISILRTAPVVIEFVRG